MRLPARMAAAIAAAIGHPCFTNDTASIDAASPLTEPTERSISPTSNTHTTPSAITPTADDSINKLLKLALERNAEFSDWNMTEIGRASCREREEVGVVVGRVEEKKRGECTVGD